MCITTVSFWLRRFISDELWFHYCYTCLQYTFFMLHQASFYELWYLLCTVFTPQMYCWTWLIVTSNGWRCFGEAMNGAPFLVSQVGQVLSSSTQRCCGFGNSKGLWKSRKGWYLWEYSTWIPNSSNFQVSFAEHYDVSTIYCQVSFLIFTYFHPHLCWFINRFKNCSAKDSLGGGWRKS